MIPLRIGYSYNWIPFAKINCRLWFPCGLSVVTIQYWGIYYKALLWFPYGLCVVTIQVPVCIPLPHVVIPLRIECSYNSFLKYIFLPFVVIPLRIECSYNWIYVSAASLKLWFPYGLSVVTITLALAALTGCCDSLTDWVWLQWGVSRSSKDLGCDSLTDWV